MSRYTLVVGNKNYSSWSLRPWLVMKHLGLEFDEVVIPLMQDDFKAKILAHSPAGKVPILKADGFDVWDSLAICEYLNEEHGAGKLWPSDAGEKALARSVAYEMHSGFFTVRNDMPMNIRRIVDGFNPSADCQAEIDRIKEIWTDCLNMKTAEGPFLFGEFSIADAMFAPVIWRFNSYGIVLEGALADYSRAVREMEIMQDWVEAAKAEEWVMDAVEL
ncbi:glutathione S-transferase family protein [Terasakiella sp. A23]|uniref:glutathione S-transferase family protein n=1 Tax=Terasakiella sp. FCG-A23 TaxID=3080561 RepID=UPI0029552534|nr:glutathione S-transferase family protein [Terasakiella sp. A23]MDV7339486.1 glutathione S-transferase family protein [Terasakiella sp. A23]